VVQLAGLITCWNVMFVAQNVMSYIDKTNFLARWGCRLYMYKITGIRYSRQDRLFLATFPGSFDLKKEMT